MSGGSFNYLCHHIGERNEDLKDMADELTALGFPEAAAATRSFIFCPSDELRRVWRAVEWWQSMDYSRDQAVQAAVQWREREPVTPAGDRDGWLCRCGRFLSDMELAGRARAPKSPAREVLVRSEPDPED